MKSLQHIFCFVIVFTTCFSSKMYAQDSTSGSFEYDGHIRNYEVFFPHNFQAKMPLVVNIHGWKETIEWYKKYTLFHEAADTSGFIVVYPQGLAVVSNKISWNVTSEDIDPKRVFPTTDDVGFISALIDTMHARYDIDLARVYCCGSSTGGEMTFRMAGECGQRFAAVASVAGTLFDDAHNWQRIRSIPVLQMHGTAEDYWFPYYDGRDGMWPISQMIDYWLNTNHCTFQPDTFFVPDIIVEDSCTAQKISFTDCDGESEFIHYKIINGGHGWPGSTAPLWIAVGTEEGTRCMDISANVEILNFFKKHQNPLANVAFGKSTEIVTRSVRPNGGTLRVKAQIANSENHPATVFARYKGENTSFQDSIQLYDDGQHYDGEASDNLWGGTKWISDIDEDVFEVRLRTRDLEEGTIHDMQLSNLDYFTSIGPVRWNTNQYKLHKYSDPYPDSLYSLKVCLINESSVYTISDVTARLTSSDPNVTEIVDSYNPQSFPDIEPGQSVECTGHYLFYAKNQPELIDFKLEILSEGYHFWTDSLPIVTAIQEDVTSLPTYYKLYQNYPNPFNPITKINYKLPITNYVELSIYNLLGQKVATLVNEKQNPGHYQVAWDASGFASGVYYYRLQAGEFQDMKKMILLK